jgi:hypothetical protein
MALNKSLSGVAEKLSATQVEVHVTREGVVATLEVMGTMQKEAEKLRVEREIHRSYYKSSGCTKEATARNRRVAARKHQI